MSKAIQALLTGMFFTFLLDFFIFLGIKQNYIDFYNIDVYYNILFADHQNIFLFFIPSIILGSLVIYVNNNKISLIVIGFLSLLALSTLIHSVGNRLGKDLLMTQNTTLQDDKHTYKGDIYYDGRRKITFFDYELNKMIILDKNKLKERE